MFAEMESNRNFKRNSIVEKKITVSLRTNLYKNFTVSFYDRKKCSMVILGFYTFESV